MLHSVNLASHYPQAPGTDHFTVSKVLPLLECHAVGIVGYLGFCGPRPFLKECTLKVIHARVFPLCDWVTDSVLTFYPRPISQGSIVPCTTSPAKDQKWRLKVQFLLKHIACFFHKAKNPEDSQVWWHTPLLQHPRWGGGGRTLSVQGQPGLQSKFHDTQGGGCYTEKQTEDRGHVCPVTGPY